MVSTGFTKALNRYVRRVGQTEKQHYPTIMKREIVIAILGNRYAKIVHADRKTRKPLSAVSFVDMRPGHGLGNVYIAASWSTPRKYHSDNILNPRLRVPGR